MTCCVTSKGDKVSIDILIAELGIFLPRVADPIARAALMRAIMSVVDKAKLLTYVITQDLFDGVTGYPVEIPGCSTVLRVNKVSVRGQEVDFDVINGNWVELGTPPPEVPNGLVMDVHGGISRESCDIPVAIYERYGDVFINRALSTLYGMAEEEWYSPEMVRFYGGISMQGVDAIKQDAMEQAVPDGIILDSRGGLLV